MKNVVKDAIMYVIIAILTVVGVHFMEDYFCEWASGIIWIAGEFLIVVIYLYNKFAKVFKDMYR